MQAYAGKIVKKMLFGDDYAVIAIEEVAMRGVIVLIISRRFFG